MGKEVTVRCGGRELRINLPDAVTVVRVEPNWAVADARQVIARALLHPVGKPPIRSSVTPGDTVVIIVDDACRPTPANQILPLVLQELGAAGVEADDVCIVVATGSHQRMTEAELVRKVGLAVYEGYRVVSHYYGDAVSFWGVTAGGIEVWTNSVLAEASYKVGVGCVIPHGSGFTGGGKIVLPGVAGLNSIMQLHRLAIGDFSGPFDPESMMRREIEHATSLVGLDFVVDVLLDGTGGIVDAFAGHSQVEHYAAVRAARNLYEVHVCCPADVVVAGCAPLETELYQVDFAFSQAVRICKPGGMVLVAMDPARGVGYHGLIQQDKEYREQRMRWYSKVASRYRLVLYTSCAGWQSAQSALPDCIQVIDSWEAATAVVQRETKRGSVVALMPAAPLTIPVV